ncbi:MAG: hypothetical protein CMC76_08600 [Flavobacteriaceae bacterium]|nr:hypothetical protein [Flavobacteriaceae bacterium]|tara:strand:- start:1064 stop:2605 length:1542 start_codon:yes stop_codon:yes gene_type:complete
MKQLIFIIALCFSILINAQVGVNNTNPQASLDVTATNTSNPNNNDGILIPRIDQFPTTNPTAQQHSMIVYLTTTVGSDTPGFYYWDNPTLNWLPITGQNYWQRNTLGYVYPATITDRVEILNSNDANGTAGSGALEINNGLRLDNNEVITNTNTELLLQYGNNGDLSIDDTTVFVDASANTVGIGTLPGANKLEIYNTTGANRNLYVYKTSGTADAAYIRNLGTGNSLNVYKNSGSGQAIYIGNYSTGYAMNVYSPNNTGIHVSSYNQYCDLAAASNSPSWAITNGSAGIAGASEITGIEGKANWSNTATTDKLGGLFYVSGTNGGTQPWGAPAVSTVGAIVDNTVYKILGFGIVSTIIKDTEDNDRIMVAPEAPEALFQDYGSGQLSNGKVHVTLHPILTKNIAVDKEHPLRVFIQLEGDCNGVFVTNKTVEGFDVIELQNGASNTKFSYQIIANRADENRDGQISNYSDMRFKPFRTKFTLANNESVENEDAGLNPEVENDNNNRRRQEDK